MDWDEVRTASAAEVRLGQDLSQLSIGELEERLAVLGAEIERVTAEMAKKKAHEAAASALFKS